MQTDPYETPKSNLCVGDYYRGHTAKERYYLPFGVLLIWPWLSKAINAYFYPRLPAEEIHALSWIMAVLFIAAPAVSALLYSLSFERRGQKIWRFVAGLVGFSLMFLVYVALLIGYL